MPGMVFCVYILKTIFKQHENVDVSVLNATNVVNSETEFPQVCCIFVFLQGPNCCI